ncbi:hypothetical protein LBMAG42_44860 [Deltaproteobacteria bacterium]|nr:hypothetical protein LBMAG42_44860 [Deltaproteobacteria bacterium]
MLVHRENVDRVAVLTLNNPPANGYSYAMHRELDAHVCDIRMDTAIDVIVIRGTGEKFFCAGADIGYLQSLQPEEKYYFCLYANETLLRLENTPKLVIAALNGHCVGGGLEIALACDLRIGRESGEKPVLVGLPEVSLGVLPGTGGTQRLTRIVGRAKALHLMVEGKNLSVEEAEHIGLVHGVFPADDWWQSVIAYAKSFCAPQRAAGAVGLIKRAVVAGADLPLESGLALERELQQRLFTAPDAKEGIAAFLGKRKPVFSGRPIPGVVGEEDGDGGPGPRNAPVGPEGRAAPAAANPSEASAKPAPQAVAASAAKAVAPPSKAAPAAPATTPEPRPHVERPASTVLAAPAPKPEVQPELSAALAASEGVPQGSVFDDGSAAAPTEAPPAPAYEIDLVYMRIEAPILDLLPTWLVRQYLVIPVRRDGDVLTIAIEDPGNGKAIAAVIDHTGLQVRALRAERDALLAQYTMHYRL